MRGRKCRRLHKIGIFSGVVIGKCEFTTRKKLYIKKLTDFFGEESEDEWEDKIEAEDIGGI